MTEIVTSRVSAGIYPAPADVGRTLSNGGNALTIPAEGSGKLNSVTYYTKLTTGAAVIREENGRRFVDSSAAMRAAYSGYYQFTCYNEAIREGAIIRFDLRIVGWDRIAAYIAAVPLRYLYTITVETFSPQYFIGMSAYNSDGGMGLLCRPYKGRIWPWIYNYANTYLSAQGSSPLPERVVTGEWIPCELHLLQVGGAYQLVLLMDGVAVYTTRSLGSYGTPGMTGVTLFDSSFMQGNVGTWYAPVPVIQLANLNYLYKGTADMAAPAVSIAGDAGETSARLTAEVTFG